VVLALNGTGVLLADDDPESLDVLQELVIHEGATVRTAIDATEVLEILQTWTPDVLLIDIGMPVVNGFELLKRIRGTPGGVTIPAVAISGYAYERDKQLCIEAGFAGYLSKPFDVDTLIQLIASLVPHPHAA
jgi:CheY-like chemotaxis protein